MFAYLFVLLIGYSLTVSGSGTTYSTTYADPDNSSSITTTYDNDNSNSLSNNNNNNNNKGNSSSSSSSSQSQPNRIVGGRPISIRQAPWQVVLVVDNEFACGGSIISVIWVLTAAHCVTEGSTFWVRGGSRYFKRGGQRRYVDLVVRNGRYNPRTLVNDIAMLHLTRPFTFDRTLRAVRLARPGMSLPNTLMVSGWGTVGENRVDPRRGLRAVNLQVVPRQTCARQYQGQGGVPRTSFCASARGRDSCYGDSGGPLVSNGVQYGIVSFGLGCARSRYPGVYTNVREEWRWIMHVARKFQGI